MKPMPETLENEVSTPEKTKILLAIGSLIGAALASSCCVMPLLLLTLGVGGAWISNLTALAPYQPLFLLATFSLLAAGFWMTYRKPKVACAEGSYCANPVSERVLKIALWLATALVLVALGINLLGPLFL